MDGEGKVSVKQHGAEKQRDECDASKRVDEEEPKETSHFYGICVSGDGVVAAGDGAVDSFEAIQDSQVRLICLMSVGARAGELRIVSRTSVRCTWR